MRADQLPIVVGVGQYSKRLEDVTRAPHPVEMMAIAARVAAEDAGAPGLLRDIDTAIAVNVLAWSYPDPVALLAELVGAHPRTRIYTSIGGNTPQWQVNETAERIAAGECQVALIAGAEAMYSLRRARKTGVELPWPPRGGSPAMVGDTRWGNTSAQMSHRGQMPTQVYPLFENALRAARGRTVAEQREFLGRFCARFATVTTGCCSPRRWCRRWGRW